MWYLLFDGTKFKIEKIKGFTPKNSLGILPNDELIEKYPFIICKNNIYSICPKEMSKWIKEQFKR